MTALARTSRTSRLIGLAGACALAIVSLSGCIKLDADLTVNGDATASGTLAIELQKEAAGFLGITDLASFEKGFASEDLGAEGLDQFTDCATSETDAAYVYTCTFENEKFEGTGGPWSITKEGDLVVLRVVNEGQSSNPDDSLNLLGDASLGSLTVAATFPGPITAVTGEGVEKTSDTSATITASLTDSVDASVTAESSSGGFSISSLLVILLALAVLALIVIVVVVLLMRRRKGPADDAITPADVDPAAAAAAATGGLAADATQSGETSEIVETVTDATPTEVIETVETVETTVVETVTDATPTEIVETVTDATPTEIVETTETVTDPEPPSA